jgi:uncharacterized protein YjiS (DUF1127 family)
MSPPGILHQEHSMNAGDTTINRRMQYHAGHALVAVLIETIVTGWRALSRLMADHARARKRAQARLELHRLSDHMLRDIGLERDQIERLFH